ncbi:hypothetical protein LCGC14_3073530, partial [marine sediment metagenome]
AQNIVRAEGARIMLLEVRCDCGDKMLMTIVWDSRIPKANSRGKSFFCKSCNVVIHTKEDKE